MQQDRTVIQGLRTLNSEGPGGAKDVNQAEVRSMQHRVSSGSAKQKLPQIFLIFWFVLHQGKMNNGSFMKSFFVGVVLRHQPPQEMQISAVLSTDR